MCSKYHGKASANVETVVAKHHLVKYPFSRSKPRKTTKLSKILMQTCTRPQNHMKSDKEAPKSENISNSHVAVLNESESSQQASGHKRGRQNTCVDRQTKLARESGNPITTFHTFFAGQSFRPVLLLRFGG